MLLYSAVCNPDKVGRQKAVSMVQTDEYVDLVYLFPEVYAGLPQFALASVSTFFFSCIVIWLMEVPGFSFLKKLVG